MHTQANRVRFIYSIGLSLICVLVYGYFFDGLLGYPLRLVSSYVALSFLKLAGIDVDLDGFLLLSGDFEFEITDLCSGYKTLQALIATAVFLCAFSNKLKFVSRVFCFIISVAFAILANGLRVFIIAYISLKSAQPLLADSTGHIVTGSATYLITVFVLYRFIRWLEEKTTHKSSPGESSRILFYFIMLCVVFAPFIEQSIQMLFSSEWDPYRPYSVIFMVASIVVYAWIIIAFRKGELSRFYSVLSAVLIISSLFTACFARFVGINSIQGIAFVFFLFAVLLAAKGKKVLPLAVPILFVFAMGLPRSDMLIKSGLLTFSISNLSDLSLLSIKLVIAVMILTSFVFAYVKGPLKKTLTNKKDIFIQNNIITIIVPLCVSLALITSIGSIFISREDNNAGCGYFLSYYLPPWQGYDIPLGSAIQRKFLGNIISSRYYMNNDGNKVELIFNDSGSDRSFLHPPEYCFTAAGWKISDQSIIKSNGGFLPMYTMEKDGEKRFMSCWFTDGKIIAQNYSTFMLNDLYNIFSDRKKGWLIFRIVSEEKQALINFLKTAQGLFDTKWEQGSNIND